MMESNADSANEPVFAAELFPYRSLGRKGFKVLLLLTGAVCGMYGMFFVATGAWPIGFFFGLDFLLLYGAFWLNYRSGRAREEISLSRTRLEVRKVAPSGRMTEYLFNPFWARFRVARHEEIGITDMKVTGEGRTTEVGSFLNPDDRETFASAFSGALTKIRRR
jgi:uncharacterized membrane protein